MTASSGPALVVTAHGGIHVLAVEDRPAPDPASDQVLVEVAAAGVNFIDVYQREGVYPTSPPFAALPASELVPVPEGIDLETAAAVMLQGLTAHYLTTSTYAVQAGDIALVHAAAGGVGQLLVQMVRARGGS